MMPDRVLSDDDLATLSLPFRVAVGRELASGTADAAIARYDDAEADYRANVRNFERWEQASEEFFAAFDRLGWARASWLIGFRYELSDDDLVWNADERRAEFRCRVSTADLAGALDAYAAMEDRYRRVHDAHRDWITWLWSEIYRRGGLDALEQCLRELAELGANRCIERDVTLTPRDRVFVWARELKANFADIKVEELDDRFVITQDPCGSCGRQVADRAYCEEPDLAVVAEPHPITFGRGNLPVFRVQVSVMHWLIPQERVGIPWPAIHCPAGLNVDVCRIELMKDVQRVLDRDADWYAR